MFKHVSSRLTKAPCSSARLLDRGRLVWTRHNGCLKVTIYTCRTRLYQVHQRTTQLAMVMGLCGTIGHGSRAFQPRFEQNIAFLGRGQGLQRNDSHFTQRCLPATKAGVLGIRSREDQHLLACARVRSVRQRGGGHSDFVSDGPGYSIAYFYSQPVPPVGVSRSR